VAGHARYQPACSFQQPPKHEQPPTPTCPPTRNIRGAYMVNWSPKLGTAVSDLEVEYSEEPGYLYYFK